MPIYEYACEACGKQFELLVRSGEAPACTSCGGQRLVRQLSLPAAPASATSLPVAAPSWGGPCGRGGCGRPECD